MWASNPDGFFDYMQDAYVDLVTPGMDMAAEAGATYYDLAGDDDGLSDEFLRLADPIPEEALRKTARWALAKGDATTGLQMLSGTVPRRLYGAARESVRLSAEAEPGARWARVAKADACGWCRMLATREAVYSSAKAAVGSGHDDRYHDDCRCLAAAVRPGKRFTPPSYTAQWNDEYEQLTREVGTDPNAIARAWDLKIAA
ncbi:MuF-like minor capsid protein [Gordonia phage Margaret]|nr:MuF-like minor capsid protein [Gordonia phage Margaret]